MKDAVYYICNITFYTKNTHVIFHNNIHTQNITSFYKNFFPWIILENSSLQRKSTFPIISMSKKAKVSTHKKKFRTRMKRRHIFSHIEEMTNCVHWRERTWVCDIALALYSFDWIASLQFQNKIYRKNIVVNILWFL